MLQTRSIEEKKETTNHVDGTANARSMNHGQNWKPTSFCRFERSLHLLNGSKKMGSLSPFTRRTAVLIGRAGV
jgi:hypothetical protein